MMSRANILIVEDEIIVAKDLQWRLESMGYNVPLILSRGEDAVSMTDEVALDLILMDIVLSGQIDGIEAAGQIHSKSDIPIIYLTSYSDKKTMQRATKTEPFGYLIKPVKDVELQSIIEMTIYKHNMERKLVRANKEWNRTFDAISDFISVHDKNFKLVKVNKALADHFGIKREKLIGKYCYEVFHGTEEPWPECPHVETLKSKKTVTKDINDPNIGCPLIVSTSPVFDENGEVVETVHVAKDISEREKVMHALQKSQERYKRITEAITNYIYTVRVEEGRPVETKHNEACFAVTGYSREELDNDPYLWIRMVIEEDHDLVRKQAEKVISGQCPEPVEHRIIRKDGTIHWLESSVVPNFDAAAKLISYDGLVRDITERKLAEKAVQESEEKYRALFTQAPDSILLIDEITGELISFNNRMYENLGYTFEEFKKLKISDFEIIESEEEVNKHIKKIIKEGFDVFETKHRRKDGEVRDVLVSSRAIIINGKSLVQSIITDVTEHKKKEQELKKSEFVLSSMAEGVNITNEQGMIVYTNSAFNRIFGYEKGELIGKHVSILNAAAEEENDRIITEGIKALKETGSWHGEFTNRKKDGSIFFTSANISEVELSGERNWISVQEDITERKNLEKAILETEEREKQRIAHDLHDGLGQMLTGISFKCQSLESTLKDKSMPEAEDAARIKSLIDKSKEQTKSMSKWIAPVEIDKDGFMASLVELASNTEKIFNIKCGFRCNKPVPLYNKSAFTHLYRIAQEAVTNAVKHSKPRYIELNLKRELDDVTITVKDDGTGIPHKRTNGLGLKIMNYRANIIGALLDIQSEIDKGTMVTCVFKDKIEGGGFYHDY